MTRALLRDERAVRDVIGFVLTFSIMVSSVGVVTIVGYSELQEFRESAQLNSAEKAMSLTGESFDEISDGQAVRRTSTIDLSGGMLELVAPTDPGSPEIDVSIRDGTGTPITTKTVDLGALQYTFSGTTITYESGAVFRTGPSGFPAVVAEPSFTCEQRGGETIAIVSIVRIEPTTGGAPEQVGGGATATIDMSKQDKLTAFTTVGQRETVSVSGSSDANPTTTIQFKTADGDSNPANEKPEVVDVDGGGITKSDFTLVQGAETEEITSVTKDTTGPTTEYEITITENDQNADNNDAVRPEIITYTTDPDSLQLIVPKPRSRGWDSILSGSDEWAKITGADGKFKCDGFDTAVIRTTVIEVSLSVE